MNACTTRLSIVALAAMLPMMALAAPQSPPPTLPKTVVPARAATPRAPAVDLSMPDASSRLRPGGYVWEPQRSPTGPVVMIVSIPNQRLHVYRGGIRIGISTVSTGKPGHETPTGNFGILQRKRMHHSNRYNNAPMPFMQRLTWDGIALHAGAIPGRPASHGCIRLPRGFAPLLYDVSRIGTQVVIVDDASVAADVLREPGDDLPQEGLQAFVASVTPVSDAPPTPPTPIVTPAPEPPVAPPSPGAQTLLDQAESAVPRAPVSTPNAPVSAPETAPSPSVATPSDAPTPVPVVMPPRPIP